MIVISEGAFWTFVISMVDVVVGFCISAFMWHWMRTPYVHKKMDESITDGDGVMHTQDARNNIAIFWSVIFIWVSINIYVGGLIYDKQYIALGGTVFGGGLILLAIKKI